jgi:peptide-methionine (S)-S-oxide reductase
MTEDTQTKTAIFGAGCFWGVEETFRMLPGVIQTEAGYTGGSVPEPTYEMVCADTTGHAEAVKVEYDPSKVTYEELLNVFWENHNPTTPNQQGPDFGSQYRSAIFTTDEDQKETAQRSLQELEASGKWKRPIVTQIVPATTFYPAEAYHQKYLMKRGLDNCHI